MVSGKLSKIYGILNRLKHIYAAQVLLTVYKSLFVPQISLKIFTFCLKTSYFMNK